MTPMMVTGSALRRTVRPTTLGIGPEARLPQVVAQQGHAFGPARPPRR